MIYVFHDMATAETTKWYAWNEVPAWAREVFACMGALSTMHLITGTQVLYKLVK